MGYLGRAFILDKHKACVLTFWCHRFAHLINVDFFNDLLNALRDVMHQFDDTTLSTRGGAGTRKRLLCITTAFQLLSGQGEALNYDLKDFYKEIYQILFMATYRTRLEDGVSVADGTTSETEAELLLQGLEMMFLRKRQIPIDRLAAFVKRFALVALNMPNKTVSRCLVLVQRLLQVRWIPLMKQKFLLTFFFPVRGSPDL